MENVAVNPSGMVPSNGCAFAFENTVIATASVQPIV